MIEPSADSAGAAELGPAGLPAGPARARLRRQGPITADTFRQLTARVKRDTPPPPKAPEASPAIALEVLDPVIEPIPPPPIVVESQPEAPAELEVAVGARELPVFAPLKPFSPPISEIVDPEPDPGTAAEEFEVPAAAVEVTSPVALVEPAIETIAEVAGDEAEPVSYEEPGLETLAGAVEESSVAAVEELVVEVAAPEPVIEPDPAPIEELAPEISIGEAAPEPAPPVPSTSDVQIIAPRSMAPDVAPGKTDRPASAVAGRVMDAMLRSVTEAIYAKPTAAERAAYLREIADLMEAERSLVPAPGQPAPPPAVADTPGAAALADALAGRLGPATQVLRRAADESDPFAKSVASAIRLDPRPVETPAADEESGDQALSLLEMMSAGMGSALPQERALAADTLLRLVPRVPVRQLIAVAERMAMMENPPALLVAKLIRDPRAEVVAPLLERCMHITDRDLMTAADEGDSLKRRMIAKRRSLTSVLSDHLIGFGDASVLLTLIRNPGAAFTHEAFHRLAEQASQHPALLAPLATRADLPAPVAFELFWFVPQELRRFIFSRFLTDSETLSKILRITMAAQESGDPKFPNRDLLDDIVNRAARGGIDEAASTIAEVAGIGRETATRILCDRDGEPVTVLLKALGYPRGKFEAVVELLKHSDAALVRPDRNVAELQSIFDTLSFNKARILLTYWDWFVQKSGPYSRQN